MSAPNDQAAPPEGITALLEQWRVFAAELETQAVQFRHRLDGQEAAAYLRGVASGRRFCADELAAALRPDSASKEAD